MAPKLPEKHNAQQHHQQSPQNNAIASKHSNLFHISAFTLCHNKRLKLKRSKYGEYLRNSFRSKISTQQQNFHKTEVRRQKLNSLKADITIDLISDDEEEGSKKKKVEKPTVIAYTERLSLERAAILGLMPVEKLGKPPQPLLPILKNHQQLQHIRTQQHKILTAPAPRKFQEQGSKRKCGPQKRRSLTARHKTPTILNSECIVLSDDSNDGTLSLAKRLPQSFVGKLQQPELSVTCPNSYQIPCLPQENTMQVDEEVTISLVPRSLNATTCASRSSPNSSNCGTAQHGLFPMLPDETTVHTVIANRIYELSLTKLREGLASCGIAEFADGQQKISPQRRKGMVQQLPVVSQPQAPISLKLSSDLSISLISDDEDELRQNNCRDEPTLTPAFLQKLPVNVSIAPVPIVPPSSNHSTESRKLKLG